MASGPLASTRISSPAWTPSTAIPVRLRASAGPRPWVALETWTSASSPRSAATKRAAGRAWSPSSFSTRSRSSSPEPRSAGASAASGVVAAELLGLHPDRAAGLAGDLVERGAAAGGGGGGDRALDQRRVGEPDRAAVRVGHLDRDLGAHERAAEVHQHEHAVVGPRALDRSPDPLGVGADGAVLHAAGRLDRDLGAHLARQRDDALGERRAVGDDDEADHSRGSAGAPGAVRGPLPERPRATRPPGPPPPHPRTRTSRTCA